MENWDWFYDEKCRLGLKWNNEYCFPCWISIISFEMERNSVSVMF